MIKFYVLTINYMGIDYVFAVKFEMIYTPNIIDCFTQSVKDSYVYKLSNTAETINYYIYQYNTLNHIDVSSEYNADNVEDFETVLQELIFPMDANYLITSKTLVTVRDAYYAKITVKEGANEPMDYYIKLNVAEA